ncbi:MAG: helix-turn-helix domain-containing protein [Calditrichaeota bacterium]|nr:MAG: helix-turn-helix domain-containing protein [Calditrichota bacterium]
MRIDPQVLEYRKQLGKRLKSIRLERELKQEDISRLFGISKGSVSEYENGKNEPPLSFLMNFAQKFGVDIAWLLRGRYQPQLEAEVKTSETPAIHDRSESYSSKNKLLNEIIEYLKKDEELLETVWHLIKAKTGINKITKGGKENSS